MESFAFHIKINSRSTEIPQKSSKFYFFSLEFHEYSLYVLDWYSKGNTGIKKQGTINLTF